MMSPALQLKARTRAALHLARLARSFGDRRTAARLLVKAGELRRTILYVYGP